MEGPGDKISVQDFAAKIKAKYPEYKDVDDSTLTSKMIQKYPEYSDKVDFSLKKKESALPPSASTSKSPSPSAIDELYKGSLKASDAHPVKMPESLQDDTHHDDDPVAASLQAHRKEYQTAVNDYNNSGISQKQPSESTGQKPKPQQILIGGGKTYVENLKNQITRKGNDIDRTYSSVVSQVLPDVDAATAVIDKTVAKNNGAAPTNNETFDLAVKKVNDFKEKEKNITSSKDLASAAVEQAARENSTLAEQIETIKKAHPGVEDYKQLLPGAMLGKLVDNFVKDPENVDVIKHNPQLQDQFQSLLKNNLTDNPEYGAVVVGNELSRARQKEGKNNAVANVIVGSSKYMDNLAEKLYKNDPQKLAIYNDIVRKNFNKYVDTKDFVSSFAEGAKQGFRGIKQTAKELTGQGSDSEASYNALKEGAEHIDSGGKGIYELTDISGRMAGLLSQMAATGGVLKGVGVGANLADKVNVGLTFFGDEKAKARLKFPGNPLAQNASALLTTGAYIAAPNAIPSGKIGKVISGVKPELNDIAAKLGSGEISKEVARTRAEQAFVNALNFGKSATKQNLKSTGEMVAITAFGNFLDKSLGLSDRKMNEFHPDDELTDVAKSMLIGNALPSALIAAGGLKGRGFTKDALLEMAENPKRFQSVMHDQSLTDPTAYHQLEGKLTDLDHLVRTNKELETHAPDLSTEQRKQYLLHDYNEKLLKDKLETITSDHLRSKVEDQIKKSQSIKENIFKGTGTDVLPQEDHLTAKEYKDVSEIKNDEDLFNHFVKLDKPGFATTLKAAAEMENPKEGIKAGLEYMSDKAVENPILFRERFGDELTQKMIERADTQKIGDTFYSLIDKNSEDPAIPILEKILDEREQKGEVYKPKETEESSNAEVGETIEPAKEGTEEKSQPLNSEGQAEAESNSSINETAKEGESTSEEKIVNPTSNETTGITHAQMDDTAREFGLETYHESPETVAEWDMAAEKRFAKDPESMSKLLNKLRDGKQPDAVEQRMMIKYIADLKAKIRTNPSNELLTQLKRAKDLSNIVGGRDVAKSLRARQAEVPVEETLADYMLREMDSSKVDELTNAQKERVKKEYDEIEKANEELRKKVSTLEEEKAKRDAEENFNKAKKEKTGVKKDFSKTKEDLKQSIKDKWKKASDDGTLTAVPIPFAKQLAAIAPDVAKLMKVYAEEGISKLSEVVKKIHGELKDGIDGLQEKHVHDIIAGVYTEKKQSRNELVAKVRDLKTEASLINRYEKLMNGVEPKNEKQKVARNKEIKELQDKIREHDLTKLAATKKRAEKEISKIEEQLKSGDFTKEEKKEPLKLDKEAQDLKDKLVKLKQEREIRILKQQYASRGVKEKTADWIGDKLNIPRTIMASMDYSAPLRQGVVAVAAHPIMALKAGKEMFKASFSQKNFDRWFYDLKESPRYEQMVDSKLAITDPHSPFLTAKEEAFMNNTAEKIPLIGRLIKGSERAYVMFLNKMRVDLFNRMADAFEAEGKTMKNSPKLYEATAKLINSQTGRGSMPEAIEGAAPLLNSVLFSPRLIASRLNLINPVYYARLPKEVRVQGLKDMLKFIGAGASILALAKLNGAQVETDPRGSDFGKIKVGNTRWDIWGGFQQYIRLISQVATAERKSPNTGKIQKLDGKGMFGTDRSDLLKNFSRGKLAPVPSMAVDFLSGKTVTGETVTPLEEIKGHFLPLLYSDVRDAMKDQGVKAIFTVGVPSTFGVGVQTFSNDKKKNK